MFDKVFDLLLAVFNICLICYINTEFKRISLMIRGIQLTLSGDLSKNYRKVR